MVNMRREGKLGLLCALVICSAVVFSGCKAKDKLEATLNATHAVVVEIRGASSQVYNMVADKATWEEVIEELQDNMFPYLDRVIKACDSLERVTFIIADMLNIEITSPAKDSSEEPSALAAATGISRLADLDTAVDKLNSSLDQLENK
jgi:hypothetical protein